jgi:hypothetical protein
MRKINKCIHCRPYKLLFSLLLITLSNISSSLLRHNDDDDDSFMKVSKPVPSNTQRRESQESTREQPANSERAKKNRETQNKTQNHLAREVFLSIKEYQGEREVQKKELTQHNAEVQMNLTRMGRILIIVL